MNREQVKERLHGTLDELRTLRDEIRLDLHLGGMDLRDEWEKLEKRLPDERSVDKVKAATREALDALVNELRAFKERLRSRV
jgi:chromosome segregation ATPase